MSPRHQSSLRPLCPATVTNNTNQGTINTSDIGGDHCHHHWGLSIKYYPHTIPALPPPTVTVICHKSCHEYFYTNYEQPISQKINHAISGISSSSKLASYNVTRLQTSIESYQEDPIFHPASVLRVICKPINYGVVSMESKVGLLCYK